MEKQKLVILDGVLLPESRMDKFSCWEEPLTRQVDMISGRRVVERIGTKWKIWKASYTIDYMGNDLLRQALAVLRRSGPFLATVLPDNSDEIVTSYFFTESLTPPSYAFSKGGVPLWHNLSFTLREERPHA